jgi:hypothetical protein
LLFPILCLLEQAKDSLRFSSNQDYLSQEQVQAVKEWLRGHKLTATAYAKKQKEKPSVFAQILARGCIPHDYRILFAEILP